MVARRRVANLSNFEQLRPLYKIAKIGEFAVPKQTIKRMVTAAYTNEFGGF